MLPQHEHRETEQQWEVGGMKDEGSERRADRRRHSCNRRDSERQQQENPDGGIDERRAIAAAR